MFKKTLLFTFLAAAIFANPVVNSVVNRFDVPIPSCYPCGPGEIPSQPEMVAALDVPIPSCYPCGPGEIPSQPETIVALDVPIPSCYPCGPGEIPSQPA